MSRLTTQHELIYNAGERFIPGITHEIDEEIRHRSSYYFFRKVIENDLVTHEIKNHTITILDLGCGTGHGSRELAEIAGSKVTGVDSSVDAIIFAKENFNADNIDYLAADMEEFLIGMSGYDYIVSRHAIEHVSDGLNLCLFLKWSKRMMLNVPYNEPPGNEFHLAIGITKDSFPAYTKTKAEFFYEDMKGVTFADEFHPEINSIICVSSSSTLSPVFRQLQFPVAAWVPSELRVQGYRINSLEAQVAQMEAQLIEFSLLLSVRIERKIRSTINRLFSNF
jgi:SAM-dependent methyltransferase